MPSKNGEPLKGTYHMKKYLLGAAAALAIAAPGVASAQQGYVDLGYSTGEVEAFGSSADVEGWQAGGAAAFGGNGGLGFQIDGVFGNSEVDGGDDVDSYTIGGHVFTRNESFLIGGFANYGNSDDGTDELDYWTLGAEGQLYLSRTTIDGAVSYSEADDDGGELTALDLGLTHFVTDNFSLGGGVGFGNADVAGTDVDAVNLGVSGEYQFSAMPISLFAGYSHGEVDDFDVEADAFTLGVRYNFGSGSLFERNRSGASLSRGGGFGRYAGLL